MHSLRQRINTRDESGFTLIELLVVLIIIGVLLAIAIPSYLGFRDRAQQRAAQANVRAAIPDAEAYLEDSATQTYAGMDMVALQGIDGGVKLDAAGGVNVLGSDNGAYCLQSTVGNYTAWDIGPSGYSNDATVTPTDGPQVGKTGDAGVGC